MRRPGPPRPPPRVRKPAPGWHRELPGRVRRYFDERRLLKYVLATILSFFVVGYIVMTLLFFPGFGRSPIATVPDLTGRTAGQAERSVERLGLKLIRGGELPNVRVRRGRVLMQTPLPGEEVPRGTQVRIVLSAGAEMRPIPSIRGLARNDAIGLLQRYGFRVAIRNVRDRREEGTLLGVRPEVGKQAPVSSIVELLVSAGPPTVIVPSVVGMMPADGRIRLQAVGLEMGRTSYAPESVEPAGSIVAQAPAAGDSLRQGASVRVTLAGPDPNPAPPPPEIEPEPEVPTDSALVTDPEPEVEPEPAPPPPPGEVRQP